MLENVALTSTVSCILVKSWETPGRNVPILSPGASRVLLLEIAMSSGGLDAPDKSNHLG